MSLNHSPSVVTNGLVLYADMNNTQKSWKGRPVTNQFTLPTAATNGFGVQNSTFTRVYTGTYGNYTIQPTDYVWQYNINGNDCPYHGWDIATTAGDVVTFSFDYYISPRTVGYPSTNYLANFENAGSGVSGSVGDSTPSITGVWKQAYITSTATATGNSRCLMYPGACGAQLATGTGFILYKNPQVEFNAPGGIPTPFVAGTRSNTQAIVDLTGNTTLTANSLTYASDGTFSFNGTSDYITAPSTALAVTSWTQPWTLGVWMYVPASATWSDGTNQSHFVSKGITVGSWGLIRGANNNSIHAAIRTDAGVYQTGGSITRDAWYNVVGTWDGISTVNTYINGVLADFATATTLSGVPDTQDLTIGRALNTFAGSPGTYYTGKLPSVVGYNRALSATEVAQNFNALRGRYGI